MSLNESTNNNSNKNNLDDNIDDSFNFNIEFKDDKMLISKSDIKKKERKLKDPSVYVEEKPKNPRKPRVKKQNEPIKEFDNNEKMILISEKLLNNYLTNMNESIKNINDCLNLLSKEINDISSKDL